LPHYPSFLSKVDTRKICLGLLQIIVEDELNVLRRRTKCAKELDAQRRVLNCIRRNSKSVPLHLDILSPRLLFLSADFHYLFDS
jgi:hypothetical protein